MKQKNWLVLIGTSVLTFSLITAQSRLSFNRYRTPGEINKTLQELAGANPSITKLHKIAVSPGKRAVNMIEIGPDVIHVTRFGEHQAAVDKLARASGAHPLCRRSLS